MNNQSNQLKIFIHSLKFQKAARLAALVAAMLLLTAALSVKAGTSLLNAEAEASNLVCLVEPIFYWPLNETGGTTFADIIAGNDATCADDNCPSSVTGLIDSALDFDGTDDRLNAPNNSGLAWGLDDSFSIEAWVKTDQNCHGNKVFVGKHGGNTSWWLGCATSSGLAAFSLRDSMGIIHTVQTTSVNDNNWHHVVGIRDGENNKNMVYVDGDLKASQTPTTDYVGHFTNNNPLTMGYHDSASPGFHYNGTLDEVAIYDRVLTQAEITAHYNSGAGQPYCTAPEAPQIDAIPALNAVVGQPFSYTVTASGNPAPTFSLVAPLIAGMDINANTGEITWTPASTGTFNGAVRASNSAGVDDEAFTITVAATPSAPIITTIPNQNAVIDQPFSYTVTASGNPTPTFSLVDPVPTGMLINASTGQITWIPVVAGAFNVTVRATNSQGFDDESFTITVTEDHKLFLPIIIK